MQANVGYICAHLFWRTWAELLLVVCVFVCFYTIYGCHFYFYNWHIFCFCFPVSLPGLAASVCLRCTQLSLHPKNTKAERTRSEFRRKMMMCTPCCVKLSSVYTLTFINPNSLPSPFRPLLESSWTFWTKLQSSGNCRDRRFVSPMLKGKFWTSIDSVRYSELVEFLFLTCRSAATL